MAATVRVKSGKSEITLNRKRNDFTVLKKKHNRADLDIARLLQAMLEEQNIKVKQLEENTKAQQNMINIRHLTLLKKKNYELENARLQEENAILKKKLGEQNNNVVKLEKQAKDLQNTIYKKNCELEVHVKSAKLKESWELEVHVKNARNLEVENEMFKKDLGEQNNKVVELEKGTQTLENRLEERVWELGFHVANARSLEIENELLKKDLGEQNNMVYVEENTKCLHNKINDKNSSIFDKQRAIIRSKVNELVESVKKGIDIYGVGPVTLSIFGFHHVVHFSNLNEIELKPLEIQYVNEIFTLLLQCKENEVPGKYWDDIIRTTVIEISRSRSTVTVADIQYFFRRTVNVDACVQVMQGITDWPVYFNLTAPKTATITSAKPDEPIFAVKQHQWEHYYFDYVFHRGAVFRDGFHPILQISTKVCVGATNITGRRLLVEDDKSVLARWRIAY
ncbi:hypothetical protein HDV02_003189 [Globomyces sp. JEL0801]|nr:hypothetical protein HDV02_003189 [Globomyces sp. JEL0801]